MNNNKKCRRPFNILASSGKDRGRNAAECSLKILKGITVITLCLFVLLSSQNAMAAFWGKKPLVVINDQELTEDDFSHWWLHWKEKNTPFPETPATFIDWHLIFQEANQMELFKLPAYQRKIRVFLSVRTMLLLKREEIDSKLKITPEEMQNFYNDNYTPLWRVQVLNYDNLQSARQAYEEMQPYNGSPAGHLPFADLQAVPPADGGPLTLEQVEVNPDSLKKNRKRTNWLPVLQNLEPGYLAEPFKNEGVYTLLRLHERQAPPADDFKKRSNRTRNLLRKRKEAALTIRLLDSLKEKFSVKVNDELLAEIDPTAEYANEFLLQPVLTMNGEPTITVGSLIEGVRKTRSFRKNKNKSKQEFANLTRNTLNGFISQTLISLESTDRHYEKEPPLIWTYDFYRQNRLGKVLDENLQKRVEVSDEEIEEYYQDHRSEYDTPAMVAYALLSGEENLISRVWTGIVQGGDFFDLAKNYYHSDVPIKHEPAGKLSVGLANELRKLVKGEVSPPFAHEDSYAIAKLVEWSEVKYIPLNDVRDKIREKVLKKKFDIMKKEYIEKLRTRSEIIVNENVWRKIKKEFGANVNEHKN